MKTGGLAGNWRSECAAQPRIVRARHPIGRQRAGQGSESQCLRTNRRHREVRESSQEDRSHGCSITLQRLELAALVLGECLPLADIVAKVENRTTLEISRKLISRPLCCCLAIQRRYEGPWSILDESIWSLTSPRVQRRHPKKTFSTLSALSGRRVRGR